MMSVAVKKIISPRYLVLGLLAFVLLSIPLTLSQTRTPKKVNSEAAATSVLQNGKLYVNGSPFIIKGINYNPISINSDQIDPAAPTADVPKMAALGSNTIATYSTSKFEWGQWSDAGTNDIFYTNLANAAEMYNLKVIVGYFSNEAIDWTDATRVAKVTSQYQNLVLKARSRPSTLMYMLGNETVEKISTETQKQAYVQWIGQMVNWTHTNDPVHPVMYADNDQRVALPYLKTYASSLDIYGYNNYAWSSTDELKIALNQVTSSWPGKPILLHEWGVDSWDVVNKREDRNLQASRIGQLVPMVEQIYADSAYPLLGQVLFAYTDDWNKLGSPGTQDPDAGWPWACKTSFDSKCNEEYWGLATSVPAGMASNRVLKPAYNTLRTLWSSSTNPTVSPTTTLTPLASPTPTLTSTPRDTLAPTINITAPPTNATVLPSSTLVATASATDNIGVSKVEFYINNRLRCTDTTAPYSCSWKVGKKVGSTETIIAKAYDAAGNNSSSSVVVSIR